MEENNRKNDTIFSQHVHAGKRTYYFDVKRTKSEKDFYIVITESRLTGENKKEKNKIFLYKEDFKKFKDGLTTAIGHISQNLAIQTGDRQESYPSSSPGSDDK
jgi:hypothetical protein